MKARAVVSFLRRRYPHQCISGARLRRMAYLADWKSAIERGRQMTGLSWRFGDHGPDCAEARRLVEEELSGPPRGPFSCLRSLTAGDRWLLRFVVRSVEGKDYFEMEKLVYSTFPILAGERHSELHLAALAAEYEAVKPFLVPTRGRP